MDQQNAIEIRGLSKTFKTYKDKSKTLKEMIIRHRSDVTENQVLKDVSLDIRKGETVALIGTNGSGKSTLLKIMSKILFPNEGTVETNGKVTSLLELGAGFHPDFTGRENIYFNAAIFGLSREEIESRVDDIIAFSELGKFIDEPVRTYSSGMYMRLAFSVAINVDADILLIDEILAVGDQHFQNKCFNKLEELRDSDKTIVIVSHALDVMRVLCDRAVWIYHGKVKLDGDPTFVISQYVKQSAEDHDEYVEEDEDADENKPKVYKPKGIVFVDQPPNYFIGDTEKPLEVKGWAIDAHTKNPQLHVRYDGKEVDFTRSSRDDVWKVYKKDFQKEGEPEQLGWEVNVPQELLTEGPHRVEVEIKDGDQILDEKRLSIRLMPGGKMEDV